MIAFRQPVKHKPHLRFYDGAWDCMMAGTVRGFGFHPLEAYREWREVNIQKGRIENDATKWPLPRKNHDCWRGAR